jgi:hypothetical protein
MKNVAIVYFAIYFDLVDVILAQLIRQGKATLQGRTILVIRRR